MNGKIVCPICEIDKSFCDEFENNETRVSRFSCKRCGDFSIPKDTISYNSSKLKNPTLSAWIRNHKENGRDAPTIMDSNLDTILNTLPKYSAVEKFGLLLMALSNMSVYPGETITLHREFDIPLAWAAINQEFVYYVKALWDRGLIRFYNDDVFDDTDDPFLVVIQPKGWEYLDEHRLKPALPDQVFVAMSFNDDLFEIWTDGIKPAVEDAGYRPYRVDRDLHNENIDAKIIAEIRNSRFVVADATEQKQGVYFEAGYAFGYNLPVILCVREDEIGKVHFDTRQYRHIRWKNPADLREQLFDTICATVGKNTNTVLAR